MVSLKVNSRSGKHLTTLSVEKGATVAELKQAF